MGESGVERNCLRMLLPPSPSNGFLFSFGRPLLAPCMQVLEGLSVHQGAPHSPGQEAVPGPKLNQTGSP